jgi:hypothetical protein
VFGGKLDLKTQAMSSTLQWFAPTDRRPNRSPLPAKASGLNRPHAHGGEVLDLRIPQAWKP